MGLKRIVDGNACPLLRALAGFRAARRKWKHNPMPWAKPARKGRVSRSAREAGLRDLVAEKEFDGKD
jgi:hypothetical protein